MIRKYFKIILLIGFTVVVFLPHLVLALEGDNAALKKLEAVGSTNPGAAYVSANISDVVNAAIRAALSLLGVVFLVLMLYAGYHWMTARGEEEKVNKAKDTITRSIIGMIIVVGAYVIWKFILNNFIFK